MFPRALREARYAVGAAVSPARHGGVAVGPHPAGRCGGRRRRGWRVWRHCLTTAPRAAAPRATGSGAFLCRPRQIWPHLRAAQVWRGRGGERRRAMVAGEDASTRAGEVVRTFDLAGEVEAERGREGVWEKWLGFRAGVRPTRRRRVLFRPPWFT